MGLPALLFFFKQKTAYEMRISYWSSDVCSSDLADTHTSALAETLAGAPTDLAYRISSTRQAGYGYYSPYIGVVRDIVRRFGAVQSKQLQYIQGLSRIADEKCEESSVGKECRRTDRTRGWAMCSTKEM